MSDPDMFAAPEPPAAMVWHAADYYRRYPGEAVTFYTRVHVAGHAAGRVRGLTLEIRLPIGWPVLDYRVLLFKVGAERVRDLERGAVSKGFREVFARHGILLSSDSFLQVNEIQKPLKAIDRKAANGGSGADARLAEQAELSALEDGQVRRWLIVDPGRDLAFTLIRDGAALNVYSRAAAGNVQVAPLLKQRSEAACVQWQLGMQPGETREFELVARATSPSEDQGGTVESRAALASSAGEALSAETVRIAVLTRSRYLKYLPAVYGEQDEVMNRLLMLMETFWRPIENQINSMYYYFDPEMAPAELLPWLGRWVGLTLDDEWSERNKRVLIGKAVALFRTRGTRQGLQDYLQIYSGVMPEIVEHREENFQLDRSRLGAGIALGSRNKPHTFDVRLCLPPAESDEAEATRIRKVEAIIEAERPAHVSYSMKIATEPARP